MLPRRLKTDGSKMNRFANLFQKAKWKKSCATINAPQSQFFNSPGPAIYFGSKSFVTPSAMKTARHGGLNFHTFRRIPTRTLQMIKEPTEMATNHYRRHSPTCVGINLLRRAIGSAKARIHHEGRFVGTKHEW